jgi:hypothetical protein
MKNLIRIHAEGQDKLWKAGCLDFDVAVRGDSLQDGLESLDIAMSEYVQYIRRLPEDEQSALLGRKAPFALLIKFAWLVFQAIFKPNSNGDGEGRAGIMLPSPA